MNFCTLHSSLKFTCSYENCNKKNFCRVCNLDSKKDLIHLTQHFEHIKQNEFLLEYSEKFRDFDGYSFLNESLKATILRFHGEMQSTVLKVNSFIYKFGEKVVNSLFESYNLVTDDFESVIKKINENLSLIKNECVSVESLKDNLIKIKADIAEQYENLSKKEKIEQFEKAINLSIKVLKGKKVKNMISNSDINLDFNQLNPNLNWQENNSPIFITRYQKESYAGIKTIHSFEGTFKCKIRINHVNANFVYSQYNYGICVVKEEYRYTKFLDYYFNQYILHGNGFLSSPNNDAEKIFDEYWSDGSIIFIKRTNDGDIYFAINDENNFIKSKIKIEGDCFVAIGYHLNSQDDAFEILELGEY